MEKSVLLENHPVYFQFCIALQSPMILLGMRQRKSNPNDETQKNRSR